MEQAAVADWLAALTVGAAGGVAWAAPATTAEPVAGRVAEITAAARKPLIFSHPQTVQDPRCHDVAVEGFYALGSWAAKEMSAHDTSSARCNVRSATQPKRSKRLALSSRCGPVWVTVRGPLADRLAGDEVRRRTATMRPTLPRVRENDHEPYPQRVRDCRQRGHRRQGGRCRRFIAGLSPVVALTASQNEPDGKAAPAVFGPGRHALNLERDRDGLVYVPKGYTADMPTPLMIVLHGAGGSSEGAGSTFPLADELGFIVLATDSRDWTWDSIIRGFGPESSSCSAPSSS